MDRLFRHIRSDEGLSLSELLVVVGMLGVVLAAAWGGFFALTRSDVVNTAQSQAAHDFSDPMEWMSKIVMQETAMDSVGTTPNSINPGPYAIGVWTNRNADTTPELNNISVDTAGDLVWESWVYDSSRLNVLPGTHNKWVVSSTNSNRTVSPNVPLFTYLDSQDTTITDMTTVSSATYRIRVTLLVPGVDGVTLRDSRDITLRNKR